MKTIKSGFSLDLEIKQRIQAVEKEIPGTVETTFLSKLQRTVPLPHPHRHLVLWRVFAIAATLLLMILFLLIPLFHQQLTPVEAEEVWVQAARVEGQPATTYVINSKSPDITIVWIEKINFKEEKNEKSH